MIEKETIDKFEVYFDSYTNFEQMELKSPFLDLAIDKAFFK